MKKTITNIIAALAVAAGLVIAAVGHGIAAFLGAFILAYAGAVTIIGKNTRWIWNA